MGVTIVRPPGASCDGGRVSSFGSAGQLASLTPLRGIAALWVVLFHFCWHLPAIHPDRYTGAVYKGYLAVDLFFVLSGFVITHVYKESFARQVTAWRYREFLKARVARIYPLHLVALLLFVATAMAERGVTYVRTGAVDPIPLLGEHSLAGLFANVLMLQGLWAQKLSWNDPSWSISLEFLAYLLFPLLFPMLRRAGPVGKSAVGGVLLTILAWVAYRTGDYFNQWNGAFAILRCLPEFLGGSLLYSGYQSGLLAPALASDAMFLAIILTLGGLLHIAGPDVGVILMFPLLILAAVRNQGRVVRLLNSAPFLWLGDVSYSLYLLHFFVLFVVSETARLLPGINLAKLPLESSLSLMAAMIGVSLGLATLSYRHIEVAARRWLRERRNVSRGGGSPAGAGLLFDGRA